MVFATMFVTFLSGPSRTVPSFRTTLLRTSFKILIVPSLSLCVCVCLVVSVFHSLIPLSTGTTKRMVPLTLCQSLSLSFSFSPPSLSHRNHSPRLSIIECIIIAVNAGNLLLDIVILVPTPPRTRSIHTNPVGCLFILLRGRQRLIRG